MTTTQTWTDSLVGAADVQIQLVKGGSGDPLLILHGEMGNPGWLQYHQSLADRFNVFVPSHPGFGQSSRPEWIMNVRDMAAWYIWALKDLGIPPCNVIGFSLGGWLAAEIATFNPNQFKKMVLVGAAGVKPQEGEIFDQFINTAKTSIETGFFAPEQCPEYQELYGKDPTPEQAEQWEVNREMACRLTWKPYMYNLGLPNLLQGVRNPTLILWGRQDAIVPLDSGQQYHRQIKGSGLKVFDNCGHHPEIEKPDEFLSTVLDFLAS